MTNETQNLEEEVYRENNLLTEEVANMIVGRAEINIAEKNSPRTNYVTLNYFSPLSVLKSHAEKTDNYKK